MQPIELAYLILVIAVFVGFAGCLAYFSVVNSQARIDAVRAALRVH